MLKSRFFYFSLLAFTTSLCACNETYKETKGGLEYRIVTDKKGETAELGDMLILNIKYSNPKDTFDTYKSGKPINAVLDSALMIPGSIEEGLLKLSSGDSAVFKVKNKVLYSESFKAEVPKEVKADERTTFYIKVDTIYKKAFIEAEQKKMIEEQMAMVRAYKEDLLDSASVQKKIASDEKLIAKYLKEKNISATRTENGVYVAILDTGKGKKAEEGDKLIVDYEGKILSSGNVFQRSSELGKPFEFVLGAGQAVLGWDEGISGLREGTKAIILIPSSLAYGEMGAEDPQRQGYIIPPNEPVIFTIVVKKVTK